MTKICTLFALLILLSVSVVAQENHQPQWFVSGGASSVIAINGSSNTSLSAKLSGGVWLNGYTGFRLNVEAGNIWMKDDLTSLNYGASLDWMANLLSTSVRDQDKFSLIALFGVGVTHYELDDDYSPLYSKINGVSINMSLQAAFKLSPKLSFFIEPGLKINPKFYDLEHKHDPYMNFSASAGVTYNF